MRLAAAQQRHEQGRHHLAAVLNWWLSRSDLSHNQASAIAGWVAGDHTWLQPSQLSHLRNARLATPQLKVFEGLAALNEAVATWKTRGEQHCTTQWGELPAPPVSSALLDRAIALWHPDTGSGEHPLVFHDFCDLFVGRLRLEGISEQVLSPAQSRAISEAIASDLDAWLIRQGGIRSGMAKIKRIYPAQRLQKLEQVILGQSSFQPEELQEQRDALALLIATTVVHPSDTGLRSFLKLMDPIPLLQEDQTLQGAAKGSPTSP